ncbi:MAG: hypothetical protein SynsKO_19680 [Synoicihabitans sp.]
MPHGPNTYSRQVTDTFTVNHASASKAKTNYKAQVTVHWDFHRRELTKHGVKFTGGMWLLAGKGPIDVFASTTSGQRQKSGTVSWNVVTGFEHKVETKTATKKFRNVYVPWIKLTRTFKPVDGSPPTTTELPQQASGIATDRGSWQPIPA